ncbi:MAG: hypothetical protein EOO40_06910, partial [Deltaproteobacteria bacterium]
RQQVPELAQRAVHHVDAVGKHLLVHLEQWVVRVHLGMHGAWHHYAAHETWKRPQWQASVELYFAAQTFVCFNAQDVELLRPVQLRPSTIGHLGPDLLSPHCDMQQVMRRALAKPAATPLIDLLLDQHVSAGLGNVYKNEILFIHRHHPLTPRQALDTPALQALFVTGQRLMQQNLGGWRRTTTYDRRTGSLGPKVERLYVYGHRDCPVCTTRLCGEILGRHRRKTYWCPSCQPMPDETAC